MGVTVKIPTQLRAATGGESEVEVEGATVGEASTPSSPPTATCASGSPRTAPAPLRQRLRLRRGHPLPAGPRDGDQRGRRGHHFPRRRRRLTGELDAPVGARAHRSMKPPVVILCGGRGTRLRERTESVPKPLVEIGGRPILWHVIGIYAAQGFERFVLATGYLGEMVEEFVAGRTGPGGHRSSASRRASTRRPGAGSPALGERLPAGRFCATYADGVADVDLGALLDLHAEPWRPGDDDRGPAQPAVGRRASSTRTTGSRASSRSRAASTGSTAASSASSPERSSTSTRRASLEREPLVAPRLRRAAARPPPRGLLGLHGHLQGRGRPRRPLGERRSAVAGLGARAGLRMKRALVTGGHGFVASHLAAALLDAGRAVAVLDRAAPQRSAPRAWG